MMETLKGKQKAMYKKKQCVLFTDRWAADLSLHLLCEEQPVHSHSEPAVV